VAHAYNPSYCGGGGHGLKPAYAQEVNKILFTIAKLWKQPRCPTIDEWVKKMWYLYTMEFYSAMKKNEILSFASEWMELENIILSEVSQTQKTKNRYVLYHMRSLDLGQKQQCCRTWVT
jgi:hypothetical protein